MQYYPRTIIYNNKIYSSKRELEGKAFQAEICLLKYESQGVYKSIGRVHREDNIWNESDYSGNIQ